MINSEAAERALDWLTKNAGDHARLVGEYRTAEDGIKQIEALLIKQMDNAGIPVSIRQSHARADKRFSDAQTRATMAKIALVENEDLMDAAKIRISLYQTMVKDRL